MDAKGRQSTVWPTEACIFVALHNPIFGPRMAPARIELLVVFVGGMVDGRGIVSSIDGLEQRDDVRVGVTDAAHFKTVFVDVNDVKLVLPDTDFPQLAQLRPRPFEKLQGGVQTAGSVIMSGERCAHDRVVSRTE